VVEAECPGCGRTVQCAADAPIAIEFDRLPDGRYLAWATGATREPVNEITVESDISAVNSHFPTGINLFGHRLMLVHERSYGGDANDRAAVPDVPPRRTGSVEVDPKGDR
jgi:hypothetical protein